MFTLSEIWHSFQMQHAENINVIGMVHKLLWFVESN